MFSCSAKMQFHFWTQFLKILVFMLFCKNLSVSSMLIVVFIASLLHSHTIIPYFHKTNYVMFKWDKFCFFIQLRMMQKKCRKRIIRFRDDIILCNCFWTSSYNLSIKFTSIFPEVQGVFSLFLSSKQNEWTIITPNKFIFLKTIKFTWQIFHAYDHIKFIMLLWT